MESDLIGILIRYLIHDVKSEIEVFFVFVSDRERSAVFVLLSFYVTLIYAVFCISDMALGRRVHLFCRGKLRDRLARRIENYRVKAAILSVYGDHSVGSARIVINAVAGAERLFVFAYLNAEVAVDNYIKLLTAVACELDGLALSLFIIFAHNIEGL